MNHIRIGTPVREVATSTAYSVTAVRAGMALLQRRGIRAPSHVRVPVARVRADGGAGRAGWRAA